MAVHSVPESFGASVACPGAEIYLTNKHEYAALPLLGLRTKSRGTKRILPAGVRAVVITVLPVHFVA
jgi:hypothetical protein